MRVSDSGWIPGHAFQVRIGWASDAVRIGEGFGKIGLGEAKEFIFVDVTSLILRHCYALCDSARR